MAYNLFIAYDLMSPGQNYEAVIHRIKELGVHWQFQYSLFWVHTGYTPNEAYAHVAQAMDTNDRLIVVNCALASGQVVVSNWDHPPIDAINAIWTQP
jgi:hypothetical protein